MPEARADVQGVGQPGWDITGLLPAPQKFTRRSGCAGVSNEAFHHTGERPSLRYRVNLIDFGSVVDTFRRAGGASG